MAFKLKIINDPVYGFIKIPHKILFDIIEHPYFQRLRRISQTGLLSLVYPGAMHTRFHHALGAMHLMYCSIETLRLKGVAISVEEEKAALIAILLHDIGHGPYSHALESVLMEDCHHEKISLLLMNELNEAFKGELAMALQMFKGEYPRAFFGQLISSQLDVDRMDYLRRDSFYTGVSEGNINTQRIISMMDVHEDNLVINAKGTYSVENFLTARMFMYMQVYFHKTSAVAEDLLIKVLKRAKYLVAKGEPVTTTENLGYFLKRHQVAPMTDEDLHRFTELDNSDVMFGLKVWENHPDFILSTLCRAITKRHFPKSIMATQAFGKAKIDELVQRVNNHYQMEEGHWLVDEIERTLLPYDIHDKPIYLQDGNAKVYRLEESDNQLIAKNITQPIKKYILEVPREVFPTLNQELLEQ